LATLAQTLLLFVPRDRPRDWFVVDNSSAIYPRLSVSAESWLREISCTAPLHAVTATQGVDPRDQYHVLQYGRWELYYDAVDSNSAVLDSTLRCVPGATIRASSSYSAVSNPVDSTMRVNYTASSDYQLTALVYYD
jgi:hypothetical protein